MVLSGMESGRPVLDYHKPVVCQSVRDARRFLLIYAAGIVVAYVAIWYFGQQYPHTTNSIDPRKAEVALRFHVAGGAAMAWFVLALRRVRRSEVIRRKGVTWLLVVANAYIALVGVVGIW